MKISFIGSGKMAEAIVASLIRAKVASPSEIFASDASEDRRKAIKKDYGVNTYASNALVAGMGNVIFLAVKPQQLDAVLAEIAPSVTREHLVISIAAGKRLARIEELLPEARVIRVMPNIACLVSEGMSVLCAGGRVQPADRVIARKLLGSVGRVLELPEDQFDAVTALSGSGPAFFAWIAGQAADAGAGIGLTREDALTLAAQTMLGTARLILEKPMSPAELVAAVSSPNGTTVEGLKVLTASTVGAVLTETLNAAARRSRELSK